jgi:hypothetical protein
MHLAELALEMVGTLLKPGGGALIKPFGEVCLLASGLRLV